MGFLSYGRNRTGLFLCLSSFIDISAASSRHLGHDRAINISPRHLRVYKIDEEGRKNEIEVDSETRLQELLCSEQVISHLIACDDSSSVTPIGIPDHDKIYPMSDDYHKAVAEGGACPLPSPFMRLSKASQKCCVDTSDANVWPNFCDAKGSMGQAAGGKLTWDLGQWKRDPVLPYGVFQVGIPEVPKNSAKYSTSLILIATYFLMGVACMSIYVYVFRSLEEERVIIRGKEHERIFANSEHGRQSEKTKDFTDSSEDEEDSKDSVGSLSPVHGQISRETGQESVGQVAMSFGLLPGLPRARSSQLTTPLMSERGSR
jgi:hypothetical protein